MSRFRILTLSLFIMCSLVRAQDQRLADSLARIYKKGGLRDSVKLELLRNLSFNESADLHLAVKYADELIALATRLNNTLYVYRGYLQKGNKERMMGNLEVALDAYFKSVDAARAADYAKGEGFAVGAIADTYSVSNNHGNAMLYYRKAIDILLSGDDSTLLANTISNAGDEFMRNKEYDSALAYFRESGAIYDKVDYQIGKGYSLGNIGMVYANIGRKELAERNISEAIPILEEQQDFYPICVYLLSMTDIYKDKGDLGTAMSYAKRSLALAQRYGLKEQISDADLKLSALFESVGQMDSSLFYFKSHVSFRDSVNNIKSVQQLADIRTDFEVAQKQVEVDLLSQEKRTQRIIVVATFVALILIVLLLMGLYKRYQFMRSTNRIIEQERSKSDRLLLNILPEETAKELKQDGKVQAKRFESVTVLFTDFKGFTHYASSLSPEKLVDTIDFYFSKFDEIVARYGLEKIKTVGDAYMCAGGLPFPSTDHALKMVKAAMEIAVFVNEAKMHRTGEDVRFDIRIGINTGPVVAGVVGSSKFAYDIWGDTVNIASRMESNSIPGRINMSENTYELVKEHVSCEYRGEIEVKNRGHLKMYFVEGLK